MNWILGMDLRPHGAGAIEFASWLARSSRAPDGEHFLPVHVLQEEHLLLILRYHHLDEVKASARDAARAALAGVEGAAAFAEPELVVGGRAEDALAAACHDRRADAVIIGRVARRAGDGIVRLGAVARRILRALPAPVVVVPPDIEADAIGTGPVVALTALRDDAPACRFGAEVARRMGRDLAVVHIAGEAEDVSYLSQPTLERIARDRRAAAEEALQKWVASQGIQAATAIVAEGDLFRTALAVPRERSAPLLVVGARGGGSESALSPSFAREIAANASMPVAVVPSR